MKKNLKVSDKFSLYLLFSITQPLINSIMYIPTHLVLCFADHEYLSDNTESDNDVVIIRRTSAELDHADTLVSVITC